ncbi:MAG: sulfur carrier protein ThiS [Deltaproteobacteria bacterium]|nr:sulfur carrier protein ThiS [Deltaproteobacteria bacterium]
MWIQVNGNPSEVESPLTLAALLGRYRLRPGQVLVERNGSPVGRHELDGTLLAERDVIEIVRFVGGG